MSAIDKSQPNSLTGADPLYAYWTENLGDAPDRIKAINIRLKDGIPYDMSLPVIQKMVERALKKTDEHIIPYMIICYWDDGPLSIMFVSDGKTIDEIGKLSKKYPYKPYMDLNPLIHNWTEDLYDYYINNPRCHTEYMTYHFCGDCRSLSDFDFISPPPSKKRRY